MKIIGYQVERNNGSHEIHPDMDASYCVYSMEQCLDMINGEDGWCIIPIYESTIMFQQNYSREKKDQIETMLITLWANIGIDIPCNFETIVQFCYEDVCETADENNWTSGDVAIAFRRWIEEQ